MAEKRDLETTVRKIIDQMVETGVIELDVHQGDVHLRLKRSPGAEGDAAFADRSESVDRSGGSVDQTDVHQVSAPLTGVFYAVPNPSARPYVEVGDWVAEGTVVGLIETMKVFNEVVSDRAGRVTAILVQQGQLVQAGEGVVAIDTSSTPDRAAEVS